MDEPGPMILAAYLKASLRFLEQDPEIGPRMIGSFSPERLQAVQDAGRLEWLPWDYIVEATVALYRAVGSEAALIDFTRRSVASTFEEPFFRPILQAGLAMLGRSPDRMASWIPIMWRAISRRAGKFEWSSDGDTSGTLRWEDAPQAAFESPIYLRGVAASFTPIFDLAGATGVIVPRTSDRQVVFSFEWEIG